MKSFTVQFLCLCIIMFFAVHQTDAFFFFQRATAAPAPAPGPPTTAGMNVASDTNDTVIRPWGDIVIHLPKEANVPMTGGSGQTVVCPPQKNNPGGGKDINFANGIIKGDGNQYLCAP